MADSSIHGALVDEASGAPAAGLRIEAWDTADVFPDPVAVAKSDLRGGFALAVTAAVLKRLAARDAALFFRVRRGDQVVADTRGNVEWHPRDPQKVIVPVRLGDDMDDAGYLVQGRVVTDRGSSAAGLRVIAYDKQLKGENELGQTDTGPSGEYVIAYQREQLGRKLFADLEVRVFRVRAQQSDAPARRIEGRLPSPGAPRHRPPGALRRPPTRQRARATAGGGDSAARRRAAGRGRRRRRHLPRQPCRMGPADRGDGSASGAGGRLLGHPRRALLRAVPHRRRRRSRRRRTPDRRTDRAGRRAGDQGRPHQR